MGGPGGRASANPCAASAARRAAAGPITSTVFPTAVFPAAMSPTAMSAAMSTAAMLPAATDIFRHRISRRLAEWAAQDPDRRALPGRRSAAITITTATSTIAPPASCSTENRSPATTTPSSTAITGLT